MRSFFRVSLSFNSGPWGSFQCFLFISLPSWWNLAPRCRAGSESNEHEFYSMLSFSRNAPHSSLISAQMLVHGPRLLQLIQLWLDLITPILCPWGKFARTGIIVLLMRTAESHEECPLTFRLIWWIPLITLYNIWPAFCEKLALTEDYQMLMSLWVTCLWLTLILFYHGLTSNLSNCLIPLLFFNHVKVVWLTFNGSVHFTVQKYCTVPFRALW